jgi:8-oxo-dGTP pyrophosphatase MutT (NUDIX family)
MPDRDIPIRPAATVILLRQRIDQLEVLLLHRNRELVFGGDHWVFPGGRIDEQDYVDARSDCPEAAAKTAAVRETREEANLHIEQRSLTAVSHWTTPRPSPKRYNTAFFVARYEHSEPVLVDGSEIVDHQWLPPLEAIEHFDRGNKKMMPPTIYTLHEIACHHSAADFIAMCAARQPVVFED